MASHRGVVFSIAKDFCYQMDNANGKHGGQKLSSTSGHFTDPVIGCRTCRLRKKKCDLKWPRNFDTSEKCRHCVRDGSVCEPVVVGNCTRCQIFKDDEDSRPGSRPDCIPVGPNQCKRCSEKGKNCRWYPYASSLKLAGRTLEKLRRLDAVRKKRITSLDSKPVNIVIPKATTPEPPEPIEVAKQYSEHVDYFDALPAEIILQILNFIEVPRSLHYLIQVSAPARRVFNRWPTDAVNNAIASSLPPDLRKHFLYFVAMRSGLLKDVDFVSWEKYAEINKDAMSVSQSASADTLRAALAAEARVTNLAGIALDHLFKLASRNPPRHLENLSLSNVDRKGFARPAPQSIHEVLWTEVDHHQWVQYGFRSTEASDVEWYRSVRACWRIVIFFALRDMIRSGQKLNVAMLSKGRPASQLKAANIVRFFHNSYKYWESEEIYPIYFSLVRLCPEAVVGRLRRPSQDWSLLDPCDLLSRISYLGPRIAGRRHGGTLDLEDLEDAEDDAQYRGSGHSFCANHLASGLGLGLDIPIEYWCLGGYSLFDCKRLSSLGLLEHPNSGDPMQRGLPGTPTLTIDQGVFAYASILPFPDTLETPIITFDLDDEAGERSLTEQWLKVELNVHVQPVERLVQR